MCPYTAATVRTVDTDEPHISDGSRSMHFNTYEFRQ
jgi:hypothetical protein